MAYLWGLPDGTDVKIEFYGNKPTTRALDRLILQVTLMRDDAKAQEADAQRVAAS